MGSFWYHLGIVLESFWDRFGFVLGSFWDRFGVVLGSKCFSENVKKAQFLARAPTRGHPYFGSVLEPSGINRDILISIRAYCEVKSGDAFETDWISVDNSGRGTPGRGSGGGRKLTF